MTIQRLSSFSAPSESPSPSPSPSASPVPPNGQHEIQKISLRAQVNSDLVGTFNIYYNGSMTGALSANATAQGKCLRRGRAVRQRCLLCGLQRDANAR